MDEVKNRVEELRRDGFAFFRNLIPLELVNQARAELMHWCQEDLNDRSRTGNQEVEHRGVVGRTRVTSEMHLLVDVFGKSPALDAIMETIFSQPQSAQALEKMAGKHIKLRGYNVRVMTGAYDPAPPYPAAQPLEWHRDSPGEMGIGILLTDVPEGGNGGTALARGSHLYPYDPRWHTLFSPHFRLNTKTKGVAFFARCNLFSCILARKYLKKQAKEANGRAGDFFYFFNDTWHGRYPNVHGRNSMIVLIGVFASECSFPDQVTPPPANVLAAMPPKVRAAAALTEPPNTNQDTLIHWLMSSPRPMRAFGWFFLARLERQIVNGLCWTVFHPFVRWVFWGTLRAGKRLLSRFGTRKKSIYPTSAALEPI
jgi:Phytanoyl-CoA dioxygenase (PhyH)